MINRFYQKVQQVSLYGYVACAVLIVLCISFVLFVVGQSTLIPSILKYTLIIGSFPLWYSLIRDMLRGSFGVDLIAGVALIGTFLIGQYLAGVVVLLMLSGGQLLESYAMNRARKELRTLLSRTPEYAHVKKGNTLVDFPIIEIVPGMEVVVKPGEIVSVDGVVLEGSTTVDESTLSGESIPVEKSVGSSIFAGTQNKDAVVVVRVVRASHETKYQAIVELVKQAEENRAPLVRLADTYSIYFTVITFAIALATWLFSHDFLRVVSVLVVATPCPLILATPIALLSGMSKASARGVIVKDGGALETLARVSAFVFDKTGTVTLGTPEVVRIVAFQGYEQDVIAKAASLDQLSTHILARALTIYAQKNNITLSYPEKFKEQFGDGVEGILDGVSYAFGKKSYVQSFTKVFSPAAEAVYKDAAEQGMIVVFLASREIIVGALLFADQIRSDANMLFKKLEVEGISKTVLLTGDKKERAEHVRAQLSISEVVSECLPDDKLLYVTSLQNTGAIVAMVGDGVNDAPALAQANVGIALGSHGKTASSDVADIVILSQSISRVYDVLHIAKKTITLAKQGILFGIGASVVAMIFGALGFLPPLWGALLQEGIDVLVIINALRLGKTLHLS
jgi:heavy metal translocating P-type ATPase